MTYYLPHAAYKTRSQPWRRVKNINAMIIHKLLYDMDCFLHVEYRIESKITDGNHIVYTNTDQSQYARITQRLIYNR